MFIELTHIAEIRAVRSLPRDIISRCIDCRRYRRRVTPMLRSKGENSDVIFASGIPRRENDAILH